MVWADVVDSDDEQAAVGEKCVGFRALQLVEEPSLPQSSQGEKAAEQQAAAADIASDKAAAVPDGQGAGERGAGAIARWW